MNTKLPTYGGQAVIEGVMMRGAGNVAIAMRAPDRQIVLHTEKLGGIYKSGLAKIPFLRGLVMLWDALGLGMRALTISANMQTGDDEKLEGPALYLTLGLSLLFGIGLFFVLPAVVVYGIEWLGGGQAAGPFSLTRPPASILWPPWVGNLLEGIIRLALMIGYIVLIGRMEDVRRVFGYHGAEHKTINAFEAGDELTPENVARHSIEHPRCGTAFLLTLILLSVLIFTLLGPLPILWRLATRILLIPVLAALAYEYIRWTAANLKHPLVRWLVRPNLALQHLTTREPDRGMLEVAIASFEAMRREEAGETVA
ncbi:MAG TPA: DUF1385 domain-containing protein [Anaerolineales bacterium]|nr:DUF1385 domain-containing protein [Anaerolineales bacterium]